MTDSPHTTISPDADLLGDRIDLLACCAEHLTAHLVSPELQPRDYTAEDKDFARAMNWLAVKISERSNRPNDHELRMFASMGHQLSKARAEEENDGEDPKDGMFGTELHFLFTEILEALDIVDLRVARPARAGGRDRGHWASRLGLRAVGRTRS